ncbi:unnamed protein product [Paramecium sonneborni]|uniref:Uncharacterized protein n=1 Tax=Paramecium sonneborni TaxID=65129 RepID=A0A8S1RLN1_9CILI|nr:unnamed protein product [Paramecium sonneborni]
MLYKICQTVSSSFTKHKESNSYLPYCIIKQKGGCPRKQKYKDYKIRGLLKQYVNQYFSNQYLNFCGNGIASTKDELCEDDITKLCLECYKIGCTSKYYDGCALESEEKQHLI